MQINKIFEFKTIFYVIYYNNYLMINIILFINFKSFPFSISNLT